jgi:hypothetical protein
LGKGTVGSVVVAWELEARERPRVPVCNGEAVLVLAPFRDVLEAFKPRLANAAAAPATWDGPGLEMGWLTLVDKYRISLPCTTRLSFDFFKSNVSISSGNISTDLKG